MWEKQFSRRVDIYRYSLHKPFPTPARMWTMSSKQDGCSKVWILMTVVSLSLSMQDGCLGTKNSHFEPWRKGFFVSWKLWNVWRCFFRIPPNQGTILIFSVYFFFGFHPILASQSYIFPSHARPSKKNWRRGHHDRWNPTAFGVQACAAVLQAGIKLVGRYVGRELRSWIGTPTKSSKFLGVWNRTVKGGPGGFGWFIIFLTYREVQTTQSHFKSIIIDRRGRRSPGRSMLIHLKQKSSLRF